MMKTDSVIFVSYGLITIQVIFFLVMFCYKKKWPEKYEEIEQKYLFFTNHHEA